MFSGCKHDGVAATFDIDGAATRVVGTVVGNDGIGFRTVGGRLLGLGQSLLGLGDLAFDLPQFLFAGSDEAARFQPFVGGLSWPAGRVPGIDRGAAGRGLRYGRAPGGPRPVGPRFPCRDFFSCSTRHWTISISAAMLDCCSASLAAASLAACRRAWRVTKSSKSISAPIVQISTARKGNSERRGAPRRTRLRVAAVSGQPKRFHAAFEVRRFDSS